MILERHLLHHYQNPLCPSRSVKQPVLSARIIRLCLCLIRTSVLFIPYKYIGGKGIADKTSMFNV